MSFSVTDLIISQPHDDIILTESNKRELYERLSLVRKMLLNTSKQTEYDSIFCAFTYDVFALFHDSESFSDEQIVKNIESQQKNKQQKDMAKKHSHLFVKEYRHFLSMLAYFNPVDAQISKKRMLPINNQSNLVKPNKIKKSSFK